MRFTICDEYKSWLREARGLARPSIVALLWEARHFLTWRLGRCGAESLTDLNVGDIDLYMDLRAPKLTRKSLKDVAERLRSLLRHLHRTGRTAIDLSPHVIAPLLYAYEGMPSIRWGRGQGNTCPEARFSRRAICAVPSSPAADRVRSAASR